MVPLRLPHSIPASRWAGDPRFAMKRIHGLKGWLLAALGAAMAAGGCAASIPPPPRPGWARIEALMSLHPAYHQLEALREWVALARQAAKEAPPNVPAPTARTFAPLPGAALRPPEVEAALDRVKQVTAEELARIAADLELRAQDEISRRAREADRESRAQIAQRRTEILRALASDRRQVLLEARAEVQSLRLRVAALELQVGDPRTVPEEKARAQARLQKLREELATALGRQADRLDALQRRYDAQLAALDQAASQRASREVAELRERLQTELEAELDRERARLAAPVAAAAREMTLGLELPQPIPLVIAPAATGMGPPQRSAALRRQWASRSRDMSRAANDLSRLSKELADSITRDTRIAAEALARANHWRLIWTKPARGGVKDVTPQAQKWLRDYWGA